MDGDGDDYNRDEELEEQPIDGFVHNPQPEDDDDDDDDFPEYANEPNKRLNQIIKEKRKLTKELSLKIEDTNERLKIIKEHHKNVQYELVNTQSMIDAKNKEIETEDHLKQLAERQIGRLNRELRKIEQNEIEKQERLNDVQNQIFKGNEKMDDFKISMNFNQEELEQWALAAKQKEEDNLALEKYKRADDIKIKELNLEIEKLTLELTRKQQDLEKEITETQAAQIELDKTAEEFKKHHEERHKLYTQWEDAAANIKRREEGIAQEGEKYAMIKSEIQRSQRLVDEKKAFLEERKMENRQAEQSIITNERIIVQKRNENKRISESINNLEAEVEILKNQLSAFASDLSSKRTRYSTLAQDLLMKKQRLNNSKKKYDAQKYKLENEGELAKELGFKSKEAEEEFKHNERILNELDKEIRTKKDQLFKQTQELFKRREQEANLYGEIQGNKAACRNLQAHINKLNQEFQRQQELLYNAEYQIQLMERKVARARGERTAEEKKDLQMEIEKLKEEKNSKMAEFKRLDLSIKKLDEDLRTVERELTGIESEKKRLESVIEELTLENDMTAQDLNKIVKEKEQTLVQHDIMKLEIKNIKENLGSATDKVYRLENRKYQLEMSMQEREKEINVHRDVLKAEYKAAEEERHKIAVELAERLNKVKNLKIKYESFVQKNQASDGNIETVNEHSQAYYVIKAAQEREELQRKGDELNAKIIKSEKELKALDNTLNHLKTRNINYRDGFINKGATSKDVQQKDALEEQCRAASENLFKKKKELQNAEREIDEDRQRLNEMTSRLEMLAYKQQEQQSMIQKYAKEAAENKDKKDRAQRSSNAKLNNMRSIGTGIEENSARDVQIKLDLQNNLSKSYLSALFTLSMDFPELNSILEPLLKEKNLELPNKAPSSIDIASVRSKSSVASSKKSGR